MQRIVSGKDSKKVDVLLSDPRKVPRVTSLQGPQARVHLLLGFHAIIWQLFSEMMILLVSGKL